MLKTGGVASGMILHKGQLWNIGRGSVNRCYARAKRVDYMLGRLRVAGLK